LSSILFIFEDFSNCTATQQKHITNVLKAEDTSGS